MKITTFLIECISFNCDCVLSYESPGRFLSQCYLAVLFLQHRFYFDKVFGEESSNEEVYQQTAYPLVQHMLNGYVTTDVEVFGAGYFFNTMHSS